MSKFLKISIVFGIWLVALSVAYYLVLRPSQKTEFEACRIQCLKDMPDIKAQGCTTLCGRHFGT